MEPNLRDEDITRLMKKMAEASPEAGAYERAWFKIEGRLAARQHPFWGSFVWRPWGHPIRWVAAAACLCLTFGAVMVHQHSKDQAELASYMESISNPTANMMKDTGIVKVSTLLSESSTSSRNLLLEDDKASDSVSSDELLL